MRIATHSFLLFVLCASALTAQTAVRREFTIFHANEGIHNLLDPETMAVDTWRSEVFVASASQKRITAFSTISAELLQTRTEDDDIPAAVRLLDFDPLHRRLLCTPRGTYPRQTEILAYDFNAGEVATAVDLGPCENLDIIPDTKRGFIYAATGREHILILDLESLAIVDSIAFDAPCSGLAFDSSHNELFAAQALPVKGISRIRKYNTGNRELIRTISFAASEPYDRLECDPQSGSVIAFSQGAVRSFDAFGQAVYEYGINDGVRSITRSAKYRRAYIADTRGARTGEWAGTRGRIHMLGFEGIEIDSLEFQFPVSDIAVCELSLTLAVLSRDEQLVYLLHLADYRNLDDVLLGKRTESAAALGNQPLSYADIAVTNPSSLTAGFVSHDIAENRDAEYPAGYITVDVAPLNASRGYAALSQGEGTLYIYDSLGIAEGSIPTGAFAGTSDRQPGIVASRDGLDHVLAVFPEYFSYAMFDTENRTILYSDFIYGFTAMNGSGKGLLQACFVPGGEQYCILRLDDRMLNVYNRTQYSFLREIDLESLNWDLFTGYERIALQPGRKDGTVSIGPYIIDTDGQHAPELTNDSIDIFLAHYGNGTSAVLRDGAFAIMEGTLVKQSVELNQTPSPTDVFAAHDGGIFTFSFTEDATVEYISVETPTSVQELPEARTAGLDMYPNPVSLLAGVTFAVDGIPVGGMIDVTFSDITGKVVRSIRLPMSTEALSYHVSSLVPFPGIYMIRLNWGKNSASRTLLVTP